MRKILSALAFTLVLVAVFGAPWIAAAMGQADAPDVPALLDAGSAPEAAAPAAAPPPNPEDDLGWWTSNGWDAARQSVPTAIVLVIFALVGLARRHWKTAREGTTGVVTSTVLAFVTILAASLLAGVSLGTAVGAALAAVLTGRALATQPVKAAG